MPKHLHRATCAIFLSTVALAAQASLVTQPTVSGNLATVNFDEHPVQEMSLGPVSLMASDGAELKFTATQEFGAAGFSALMYGFGDNGLWKGSDHSFVWANGDTHGGAGTSLRFEFLSAPVSSVGGFLNYVVTAGNSYYDPAVFAIKALDQFGTVLEIYHLEDSAPIRTPGTLNASEFRGIVRDSADIYAFEIQGAGAIASLLISSTAQAVPEPESALLAFSGLAAFAALGRRRPVKRGR